MIKKRSAKTLKSLLDKAYSEFIRRRNADENGTAQCITCGKLDHWKNLQCGHWHSRRHLGTRWDVNNSHVQCGKCNVLLRGNPTAFARFMYSHYSQDEIDKLAAKTKETTKITRADYEILLATMQSLVEGMK